VRENTHLCIEEEIRQLLPSLLHEADKKRKLVDSLISNEDILFYWEIVGADFEEDDQQVCTKLLRKILELFLTVRGFSYASVWLENYKQRTKRGNQKAKSLHKKSTRLCIIII